MCPDFILFADLMAKQNLSLISYQYQQNLGNRSFKNLEMRNFTLGIIYLYCP